MIRAHRSHVLAVVAALSAVALPTAAARADADAPGANASGADIVGFANAERAANGLPAVTEDTAASAACAAWVASGEQTSAPDGASSWDDYGYNSGPWTATHDPFLLRPDEFATVLAPRLATVGAAEIGGHGCATLGEFTPSSWRPAPAHDITYTYPGDGTQDVRTSQFREDAIHPSYRFDETGPVLFAFFDGPDLDPRQPSPTAITAASLTGPGGAPVPFDMRAYPAGQPTTVTQVRLIPRAGLAPFNTYHAAVTADVTPPGGTARSFAHAWSFTTGALENEVDARSYTNAYAAGPVTLAAGSRAPEVTMTATKGDATITRAATAPDFWSNLWFTVPLTAGIWHVCFASGGPGTDYRAASSCEDVPVFDPLPPAAQAQPGSAPVVRTTPKPAGSTLGLSIGSPVHAMWRGRTLSVPVKCTASCSLKVAWSLRLDHKSYRLPSSSTAARRGGGTVTAKYTMSKAVTARLRRARIRKLWLTITPKGDGRPLYAVLQIARAK